MRCASTLSYTSTASCQATSWCWRPTPWPSRSGCSGQEGGSGLSQGREGGSDQHELVYVLYTCPMAIEEKVLRLGGSSRGM